eukprot:4702701-Amphidinium_carterae.1
MQILGNWGSTPIPPQSQALPNPEVSKRRITRVELNFHFHMLSGYSGLSHVVRCYHWSDVAT